VLGEHALGGAAFLMWIPVAAAVAAGWSGHSRH
jgi:hypothetical protein